MLGFYGGLVEAGPEIRAAGHGALIALFPAPVIYAAVVAAEEDGRNLAAMPLLGAGILGILQQSVPVALVGIAALLGQHPLLHTEQAVRHGHGRNLAAGEDEVAHAQLLVHALVNEALVHPLIVSADQEDIFMRGLQLLGYLLGKGPATGGHIDRVGSLPYLPADMLPAAVQGVCLHHRTPTAAVGVIVHLHLLIGGILPNLVGVEPDKASVPGPADDRLAHHGLDGIGEQGHNVNSHRWPILSYCVRAGCRRLHPRRR